MADAPIAISSTRPARIRLEPYSAEIRIQSLSLGIDNIHYDVFLSPKFVAFARKYLLDTIRQSANVNLFYGNGHKAATPETPAFRKQLSELLQTSLTIAKFEQNIEIDLLHRIAVLKFLLGEIGNQLSSLIVECKEWIHSRGGHFEHSEQAHRMRARITEIQADRKNIFRQVGQALFNMMRDLEDNTLAKSRRALFGEEYSEMYDLFKNRLLFVDGGNDETLLLEHYVLLGNFVHDADRFEVFDALLIDFVRDFVLAGDNTDELSRYQKDYERMMEQARSMRFELFRLEEEEEETRRRSTGGDDIFSWPWKRRGSAPDAPVDSSERNRRIVDLENRLEEMGSSIESTKQRMDFLTEDYRSRIGGYLNEPANARRLFDSRLPASDGEALPETRAQLLRNGSTGWKSATCFSTFLPATSFARFTPTTARRSTCSS